MINLIPPHARKEVKHEYWIRVVTVWFFLCITAMGIVALLYIPVYVLIQSQIAAYEETYQRAVQNDSSYKEIQSTLTQTNATAQQLLQGADTQSFSEIIDALERIAGTAVVIEEISSQRNDEGYIETVRVQGIAATREELASFRDMIEAASLFASAELPISNLAKDKDASFAITVRVQADEI